MVKEYDFLKTAVGGALDIYGDEGNFVLTKEALVLMDIHPYKVVGDLESAITQKARELGKNYEFSVSEEIHPDLGDAFRIYWRPIND